MTEPTNGVRDFTINRPPIGFKVDDDVFYAPGFLSPIAQKRVANMWKGASEKLVSTEEDIGQALETIANLFKTIIGGAHGQRFADRLLSEGREADPDADPPRPADPPPIDLQAQAIPILYYLMERWGLRPTQPSSNSAGGSPTPTTVSEDTSSTAGPSPTESDPTTLTTPPTG